MNGDLNLAWDVLQVLIIIGFILGVVGAVLVGSVRIGWKYAPVIVVIALIIYMFGGI